MHTVYDWGTIHVEIHFNEVSIIQNESKILLKATIKESKIEPLQADLATIFMSHEPGKDDKIVESKIIDLGYRYAFC